MEAGRTGQECRNDAVDRDQVRVVPRGDDKDDAERLAANEAAEACVSTGRACQSKHRLTTSWTA